jgi:chromosome segregation ATPase
VERLRAEQNRYREAFLRYNGLWEECFRRSAHLEQEQRALAEKSLALEQYRLECIGQAENSAVAERRLERLRRRSAAFTAAAERRLARDRQDLETQFASLEEHFQELQQRLGEVAGREVELSSRQTDSEYGHAATSETIARLHQNLHSLRAHRDLSQWQVEKLREAVERMALTLIEEAAPPAPPKMQAA